MFPLRVIPDSFSNMIRKTSYKFTLQQIDLLLKTMR